MSLEGNLRTALLPTCPRIYPDAVTEAPVYPLTIYQDVPSDAFDYMEGRVPDKAKARIQLWVWAESRLECKAIARTQRIALVEGSMKAQTLNSPGTDYNETLKIYGCRQDFSVWYTP